MDAPQGTPTWVTSFGWAGGLLLAICEGSVKIEETPRRWRGVGLET